MLIRTNNANWDNIFEHLYLLSPPALSTDLFISSYGFVCLPLWVVHSQGSNQRPLQSSLAGSTPETSTQKVRNSMLPFYPLLALALASLLANECSACVQITDCSLKDTMTGQLDPRRSPGLQAASNTGACVLLTGLSTWTNPRRHAGFCFWLMTLLDLT